MEWTMSLVGMVGLLFLLMACGVPIAVTLIIVSVVFIALAGGGSLARVVLGASIWHTWTKYNLLPLPLFILMADFLLVSRVGEDLFDVVYKWLGRVRGSLAMVTIATCAAFATMSGSSIGATSVMSVTAIPEMERRRYSIRLAAGSVGAAGGLAHLIPPSALAIVYASLVEVSAGKQLMAGLIPGFILAIAYSIVVFAWASLRPSAAPHVEVTPSWRERFLALHKLIAPFIIVILVLGTIYAGIATVTEAAAAGAFGCFIIAIVRGMGLHKLREALLRTAAISAYIMFIVGGALIFGFALSYYQIPQHIVEVLVEGNFPGLLIIGGIQIFYILLGMILDPTGMLVITMSVVHPILIQFGFDPIWFGVLALINIELASVTPPLGMHLYVIKGIHPHIALGDIIKGCLVFTIADCSVLALVMAFPQLALWLPQQMVGW